MRTLVLAFLFIYAGASAARLSIDQIPEGFGPGRVDAPIGAYNSTYSPAARVFQDRLLKLRSKALGLASITQLPSADQSEYVLLLETELLRLHLEISHQPTAAMSSFERASLLYGVTHAYEAVRVQGERLFEQMVRYIDVKIPGPNGVQLRQEVENDAIYLPNYRSDIPLSEAERARLYAEKRAAFLAGGGSFADVKVLTSAEVNGWGDYTRVEFVELNNGDVMFTHGSAGHILLAEGGTVRTAGQIVLLKDGAGKPSLLVVSNASGSYKPDLFSSELVGAKLQELFGLRSSQVVVTSGEPMSTQAVRIFLKGEGVPKGEIEARSAALQDFTQKRLALPTPENPSPSGGFDGLGACARIFLVH